MLSKEKNAYIFLVLATLFWSGNFIVGKAASLFEIPPFTLNFYRWTFAWLILAPFTLKEILKKKKIHNKKPKTNFNFRYYQYYNI